MSEGDAFEAERFLISYYGRVDLGTGSLRNLTDGGDGASGAIRSEETKRKQAIAKLDPTFRAAQLAGIAKRNFNPIWKENQSTAATKLLVITQTGAPHRQQE